MLTRIKRMSMIFALCAVGIATVQGGPRHYQDLPDGAGGDVVRQKCIACHESDLIKQQRLSRAAWTREVEKMIRWGTKLSDSEKESAIGYLSMMFGPRSASRAEETREIERGRGILEASCVSCHEMDLIEQQRLSRAGWTREVDKMIRWGANVKETDKVQLIDYLSGKFNPEVRSRKQ